MNHITTLRFTRRPLAAAASRSLRLDGIEHHLMQEHHSCYAGRSEVTYVVTAKPGQDAEAVHEAMLYAESVAEDWAECEGHETMAGHIGQTIYCDGMCKS